MFRADRVARTACEVEQRRRTTSIWRKTRTAGFAFKSLLQRSDVATSWPSVVSRRRLAGGVRVARTLRGVPHPDGQRTPAVVEALAPRLNACSSIGMAPRRRSCNGRRGRRPA